MALMRVPEANVTWTDGAMLKHKARRYWASRCRSRAASSRPVIRSARTTKTLSVISNEMKDYAARRPRPQKLKPEEYQGGTSAVSNLGMFGVKDFAGDREPAARLDPGRRGG